MTDSKRPQFRNSGVASTVLITQVENTAPFLFSGTLSEDQSKKNRFVAILNEAKRNPISDDDLWSYFEVCVASHFASVGTFVPTDVDNAIRVKLWHFVHNEKHFETMWNLIEEFHDWDESPVSHRYVVTASGRKLSGHQGEWFTLAVAAYQTARRVAHEFIPEVREAIEKELKNQELALTELKDCYLREPSMVSAKDYYAGASAVAHNLGDLDRMFGLWEIEDADILKRRVYRSGHEDARHPKSVFLESGRIYQTHLANENHRHFALREAKPLRISPDYLLPFGPFMDDWGKNLVVNGYEKKIFSEGDLRIIVEALIKGWKKLNASSIYHAQGYARALYGIAEALGGKLGYAHGRIELENLVPPVLRKELTQGGVRTLMNVSKSEFEKKWMSKLRVELSAV